MCILFSIHFPPVHPLNREKDAVGKNAFIHKLYQVNAQMDVVLLMGLPSEYGYCICGLNWPRATVNIVKIVLYLIPEKSYTR